MPIPTSALTQRELITNIRNDLGDTNSAAYQWSDTILGRQIDRAVERYSKAAPNYSISQIPTIKASRLYASPFQSWWMESVEYPLGQWPKQFQTFIERQSPLIATPTWGATSSNGTTPTGGGAAGSGPPAGTYLYAFSYLVPGAGETLPSATISVVTTSSGPIDLTGIPLGPYGVIDRNVYRSHAGGSSLYLVSNLGDNTSTTFIDSALDTSLMTAPPAANSTEGIAQFELFIADTMMPADGTGLLQIVAAYKHEIDQYGTTIPEKHWDCITYGAEAFAILQYVTSTNDNFEYVDGQFRDRVDDSKAPTAWMAQYRALQSRFEARLEEIRNETTVRSRPAPQWGDKPARWNRI